MVQDDNEIILTIHAKTRSRTESVEWIDKDTLKVCVKAIPEKGKANEAIIELVSRELGIKKSSIELIRGFSTHIKQIKILGYRPPHL